MRTGTRLDRKIALLIIAIFFAAGALPAGAKSVLFNEITVHDGLPQMSVRSIVQDKDGYIWFATRDGLSRYDGYRFKTYKEEDGEQSVSNNEVTSLICTSDGTLWAGTAVGLNRYDSRSGTFTRYLAPTQIPGEYIYRICEDRSGHIWVTTSGGFVRMDSSTGIITKEVKSIVGQIKYVAVTPDPDVIVVATSLDVFRYTISTDRFEQIDCVPSNLNIQTLFCDSRDNIWIGTAAAGVWILSPDFSLLRHLDSSNSRLNNDFVRCFCEDKKGRIVIGTFDGVNIYSPEDGSMLSYKIGQNTNVDALSFFSVLYAYCDRDNTIWLSSYVGGVNYFNLDDDNFLYYEDPAVDGKTTLGIVSSIVRSNGGLWVGKEGGGLLRCDEKTGRWERVPLPSDKDGDVRSSIVNSISSRGNDIIVGLNNGKMYRIDTRSRKVTQTYSIRTDQPIVETFIDAEGNIFVGTYLRNKGSDLIVFGRDGKMQTSFTDAATGEPASFTFVQSIIEGKDGSVILGSSNNGICSYNLHSCEFKFRSLKAISPDRPVKINHLVRDTDGNIWAGTRCSGLLKLDDNLTVTDRFTRQDGLPSDNICSIAQGSEGKLWVTTPYCVSSIDVRNRSIRTWSAPQVNEFSLKSCLATEDRIIFGADKGLVTLNPSRENNRYIARKPVVEILRNDSEVLEFGFSSLDYVSQGLIRFEYKLDGYDSDYISELPTRAGAVYKKLRPGKYEFRVKAFKGPEDEFGSEETVLGIRIPRPWWQRWWVILGVILLAAAVVILVLKLRKAAENLEEERDRMQRICADMFGEPVKDNGQSRTPDEVFMQRFYKLLRDRLADQNLTIDYMCAELGTSKTGLYNKVKKHTGLAPVDFIRRSRLQASAQLLKEGRHPIAEISSIVGFSSPSYYSSCFKKEYGMTPREYIDSIDNNLERNQ
ncbi:MAG: two-component regulator propeller domain-containing protein [Candidatus Cryptobacteroides sp.]|nr:two-component regulator propeller domain-containing protein [Candidatus Cryptobacteroides sp.]